MSTPRLLSISHLLVAAGPFDAAEAFLAQAGYRRQIHQPGYPNPPAKAPFVAGPLAPDFEMSFLRATGSRAKSLPAIELLREIHTAPSAEGESPFTVELPVDEPAAEISSGGIRLCPGGGLSGAVVRVSCRGLDAALAFWRWLGGDCREVHPDEAVVVVRSRLFGASITLHLVAAPDHRGRASLNQRGLVALAFTCADVGALRAAMIEAWAAAGAEIGECFDITPLGKPLRLFLVRAPSGEIYEFLSPLGR